MSDHSHHDHGHSHGHSHAGHSHGGHAGHSHAPASFGRAFAIGIVLNTGFVAIEAGYGFATQSIALLADAGHNLADVLGLAVAWAGATLAQRAPSKRYTYGLRSSSILAALTNALLLLVALGAIVMEAIHRFGDPAPVAGITVSVVAGIGIAVNLGTALLFMRGQHDDINTRAAFLHMMADAAVSAGVVVTGLIIWRTGLTWIDPAVSLVIAALIFWQTWGLLKESVAMSMDAVPRRLDYDEIEAALIDLPGVEKIHDLHIWPMSTTETVLTVHLVTPAGHPGDGFLVAMRKMLQDRFGIGHATAQIEVDADCLCSLEHGV
jgi:cobalt-zinc-cadmium efflux system protein